MSIFNSKKNDTIRMLSVADRINEIIRLRHERLPIVLQELDELSQIEKSIASFNRMKTTAIDDNGNVRPNTEYTGLLTKYPLFVQDLIGISFDGVKLCLSDAREKLELYRNRLDRNDVTIAICGHARIGKSLFLSEISGLKQGEIPVSDGSDCTGKPSIIYNREKGFTAHISFVSEKHICDVCNRYITTAVGESDAYRYYVRAKNEIKNLNVSEIYSKAKSRGITSYTDASKELQKIVESFDEWAPFIDKAPMDISDRTEVPKYVAQKFKDEFDNVHEYHLFYAVDRCEIYTKFIEDDLGKLTLLDTVGLGDKKEGIEEEMLSIIKDKCDAFIYCICPTPAGNGIDAETSNIISRIQKANTNHNLSNWMGVVLNKVTNPPKGGNPAKNIDFIDSACKTVREDYDLYTGVANFIESGECVEYLNDFLAYFITHLNEVDDTYLVPASEALQNLKNAYQSVVSRIEKAISKTVVQSPGVKALIVKNTTTAIKQIQTIIRRSALEWEEKVDDGCPILISKTEAILNQLRFFNPDYPCDYIPPLDEIQTELDVHGNASRVFDDELGKIRVKLSNDFYGCESDLSTYVTDAKNEIARILYEDCGFSKLCPLAYGESTPTFEWLKQFSEKVLSDYPALQHAVEQVYSFSFSLRGFLTFEVRLCLDKINPSSAKKIPTPAILTGGRATAQSIYNQLGWALVELATNGLDSRIKELECKPNRAIYALIGDFYENLFSADSSGDDWRIFYENVGSILWANEIKAVAQDANAFEMWSIMKNELRDHLNKNIVFNGTF